MKFYPCFPIIKQLLSMITPAFLLIASTIIKICRLKEGIKQLEMHGLCIELAKISSVFVGEPYRHWSGCRGPLCFLFCLHHGIQRDNRP